MLVSLRNCIFSLFYFIFSRKQVDCIYLLFIQFGALKGAANATWILCPVALEGRLLQNIPRAAASRGTRVPSPGAPGLVQFVTRRHCVVL